MSRRFFVKLLLYVLPCTAYLVLTIGIATYAGEFTPLAKIVRRQAGQEPVLYGRAYRDNFFAFKLIATRLRQPEVLVIGSSRVMQFRSMLFNRNPSAFYNAGGAAQTIYEVGKFLCDLNEDGRLRVLFIGLDHPWFNARSEGDTGTHRLKEQTDEENRPALDRALGVGPKVASDFLNGKIRLDALRAHADPVYGVQALGLNAIMNGNGFRNDGSYQYGAYVLHPPTVDQRLAEAFQRLRDDMGHYSRGAEVSEDSLHALEGILRQCQQRDVFVVGFSPPFAPAIYDRMMADGRYTYIYKSARRLAESLRRYGFAYFDFSNTAWVGATDNDMIDGFHGSEYVILKMYSRMLKTRPDVLAEYSDPSFLEQMAQRDHPTAFELFGNQLK